MQAKSCCSFYSSALGSTERCWLLFVTLQVSLVKEILEFVFVLQTLLHDQVAPVDGEDPTNQDVGEEQLKHSHHEQCLAPLGAEATNDHCAKS